MKRTTQALGLAGWLTLTFVAAALGARASISASDFYSTLSLPAWAPPAGLFGPVWTVLYALMAVAAWLVWREKERRPNMVALVLYVVQLAANTAWSWLFFGWKQGALAFVDILALLALIIATVIAFARIRTLAAILLLPYLLWVGFAAVLNYAVWQANPGAL
ncbi:tryptophan-rich sensory protein [Stenotrophomonas sp. GD04145]|jgi:tryptophan-rich sensory protein|uniref:TspO/MBR family protein n=1 Tax=unclassified Stenotrophomonas TaxID=196198 RepID=UPI001009A38E|nr:MULTISPECIES: TspO/MBR family protein [unclassified Stenotrophomonas]MDH0170042.1 tryptophan-rich sensory protein [Stenotrophomonas sp. GD04145]RXK67675.1 tryptophan-rich sensory protein [Stenotrophomonas sp. MA5]